VRIPIKRNYPVIVTSYLSLVTFLAAQDISSDFLPSRYLQILHDHGVNWKSNSSFKPYQWDSISELITSDSNQITIEWMAHDLKSSRIQRIVRSRNAENELQCNAWFGTLLQYSDGEGEEFQDGSTTLYGYFHFSYRNNFRGWLYPRITTNQYSIPHYTGNPRPNRRAGFNTGETDMAGIGYFGDWLQAWVGRGRQNWGAMSLDNLALSEKSAAYDHGTLQLRFNNVRLRYFHGYLEILENSNNRYITGRGIEYNNKRNLVIGAHEIVIYSGEDRPMDIAYFNPIATHLEVELNQRDNRPGGTGGGNAIWQLALDWMPIKGLRFSGNILADEIVIDDFEREEGKPHALAYQGRLAWSDFFRQILFTVFTEYTQVGTYTLRHEDGGNNFVSRDLPLGTELGSDGDCWQIGARIVTPWRMITTLSFGKERSGEQSILKNPYEPYDQFVDVPFPSGDVHETAFFRWEAIWSPRSNVTIKLQSQLGDSKLNENRNYLLISLDAYLPTFFEL